MISEVTSYYDTLNLGIKIYKRGLEFLNRDVAYTSDAGTILNNFKRWLDDGRKHETLKYDMAILLTGYDLTRGGSNGNAGLADLRRVCDKGAGIAEMRKSYFAASTVAHEMAHILGADHDHDARPGYIMAPSGGPGSKNRWSFSSTSRNYISNYINQVVKRNNCFNEKSRSSKYVTGIKIPNNLRNPSNICKRIYGAQSALGCSDGKGGDKVCKSICCSKPRSGSCDCTMTFDGMTCGNKKSCKKGRCVHDSSAPSVPDNCPYGDAPSVNMNNKVQSCQSVINTFGKGICTRSSYIGGRCCSTCAGGGNGGGNNNGNGNGGGNNNGNGNGGGNNNGGTSPGCVDHNARLTVNGRGPYTCSSLFRSWNSRVYCYSFGKTCCASCKRFETSIASCKYGDKYTACSSYRPSRRFCARNKRACCKTCAGYRKRRNVDFAEDESPQNVTVIDIADMAADVDVIEMADNDVTAPDVDVIEMADND